MYSLNELKTQNQEITQLCDVLSVLMEQQSFHDNPYVRELMKRFKEKVWVHLVFEDNTIYAALLHADDEKVSLVAKAFHDSAKEIKTSLFRLCKTLDVIASFWFRTRHAK